MKIVFPNGNQTYEETEEILKFAIECRKRVKDQLKRIDSTFGNVQFAYTNKGGKLIPVSTLEEIEFPQFYYQRDASDEKEDQEIIAAETKNELGKDAYWILALGGIGISAGLAVYGYKIIKAIGVKMCKITPSRGISIELASALVIITGSRFEIPLSTTHCQVGATVGVALLEDPKKCSGINKMIFVKTLAGWIITLIVAGSTTSLLVSQGSYAPCTSGF